jgi:DinB family
MMPISDFLLPEFDHEMKTTRVTLERVPFDKQDFAPHQKSMPLGKLAPHVAELPGFGQTILTTPELDFSNAPRRERPPFESVGLLKSFDENVSKVRATLKNMRDDAWTQNWKLSFQGKEIFNGPRFLAYREMFLNHLVHHRAQLGVYLRLNGRPLPATYGPSADDTMGF